MKIKKFIGASYSALQNQIVLDYMAAAGFKALSMEPIDVPFDQVAQISVETLYAHVKRLYRRHRDADGVYIQGGGWQTVRVIELLEKDLAHSGGARHDLRSVADPQASRRAGNQAGLRPSACRVAVVWRFRSPHHFLQRQSEMRTSELSRTRPNKLLRACTH